MPRGAKETLAVAAASLAAIVMTAMSQVAPAEARSGCPEHFPLGGPGAELTVHHMTCKAAKRIVLIFYGVSQTAGPHATVRGFDCRGKSTENFPIVRCRQGDQRLRYRGGFYKRRYVGGLFTAASARSSTHRLPRLSDRQAESYMDQALSRKFGGAYTSAIATKLQCHHRHSRVRVGCDVIGWAVGDAAFYGSGRIWESLTGRGVAVWNYAYRITRLNEYCADVHPNADCTKTFRVR